MKKKLLLLLLVVNSIFVYSQTVNVVWGPELKEARKTMISDILGRTEKNFYALRSDYAGTRKVDVVIECYDNKTMDLVYSKKVEDELKKRVKDAGEMKVKNLDVQEVYMLQDRIVLLVSYYNSKEDYKALYAASVNLSDGSLSSDLIKVDEIKEVKKSSKGAFSYAISGDSTKLIIYHDEVYDKNKPERYAAKLYTNDIKLIWSKDFEMAQLDKDVVLDNFEVDKDGVFYTLAKLIDRKSEKGVKVPNYFYEIISYTPSTKEIKVYDLKIGEKFINDIRFELEEDGNLTCAGFYSERNKTTKAGSAKFNRASGVFYLKIDKNSKEILSSKLKDFDRSVYNDAISKSRKADKAEDLASFEIDDFIFKKGGGMLMVSEQYFVNVVCTTDPKTGIQRCTYYYNYNQIMVCDFAADGTVNWIRVVPKYQVTTNDNGYYSSYLTVVYKDKLFLVYNDNPKNALLTSVKDKLRPMNNPKKSLSMLVEVDSKGNIKKTELFKNKELGTICRPKISNQTDENEVYIFGEKGKMYRFGKVNL